MIDEAAVEAALEEAEALNGKARILVNSLPMFLAGGPAISLAKAPLAMAALARSSEQMAYGS